MNRWHSPPAELYALVEQTPASVLLECSRPNAAESLRRSRSEATKPLLTRLFMTPLRVCTAHRLADIPEIFKEIESAVAAGRYAAGYFSYECGVFFEPSAARAAKPQANVLSRLGLTGPAIGPLAWIGIYDAPILFDHRTGTFTQNGQEIPCPTVVPRVGEGRVERAGHPMTDGLDIETTIPIGVLEYVRQIATVEEKIRAGDLYQLNYTIPIRIRTQGGAAALYRRLYTRQPAPYAAFVHTEPGKHILSFSPELFFRVENEGAVRRITTRPMKGTVPRGRTAKEDRDRGHWLQCDAKNRAENVMIVDLLRNDLGRVCNYGSVQSTDLFAIERYPTLWQMTSTVSGELRPEAGFKQIFRALFPCGSITGAPKVRAMQLISELEPESRGVYTGAIGFFSKNETVFSVAIRTVALEGDEGTMGVGSGVVIDSDPAAEYRECLLKAQFLTSAIQYPEHFSLVETLLWDGGYPLIELHLGRLADSAAYFGFPCERWEVRAALMAEQATFAGRAPRKVRLLLDMDGALKITSEILPEKAGDPKPLRIRIASQRTDTADRMYYHKTTHRPLYAEALTAAINDGYDDVLFLNERGEVTECANHNIFIQRADRLITPRVDCGLLPGVHRRLILETHPNASESALGIEDLRKAEGIFLSNAVRGLRAAVIDWEN